MLKKKYRFGEYKWENTHLFVPMSFTTSHHWFHLVFKSSPPQLFLSYIISSSSSQGQQPNMASPSENFASKLTALVVDDDGMPRRIHQMTLSNLGVNNTCVKNGKETVEIRQHGKKFDLILMDKDMPEMNGTEVYFIYITPQFLHLYITMHARVHSCLFRRGLVFYFCYKKNIYACMHA
jgi:PleD family two-component response regulator